MMDLTQKFDMDSIWQTTLLSHIFGKKRVIDRYTLHNTLIEWQLRSSKAILSILLNGSFMRDATKQELACQLAEDVLCYWWVEGESETKPTKMKLEELKKGLQTKRLWLDHKCDNKALKEASDIDRTGTFGNKRQKDIITAVRAAITYRIEIDTVSYYAIAAAKEYNPVAALRVTNNQIHLAYSKIFSSSPFE